MKIKVIYDIDTDTGDYEMQFVNVSHPGQGIDAITLAKIVQKVSGAVRDQVDPQFPATKISNKLD